MSHAAIAAVLAADELSVAERLAAFSLASFANSDQLAWPGNALAAVRSGLRRGSCSLSAARGGRHCERASARGGPRL